MKVLDVYENSAQSVEDLGILFPELLIINLEHSNPIKKAYILENLLENKFQNSGEDEELRVLKNYLCEEFIDTLYDSSNHSFYLKSNHLIVSNILIKTAYQYHVISKDRGFWTFSDLENMLSIYEEAYEYRLGYWRDFLGINDEIPVELFWLQNRLKNLNNILDKRDSIDLEINFDSLDSLEIYEKGKFSNCFLNYQKNEEGNISLPFMLK